MAETRRTLVVASSAEGVRQAADALDAFAAAHRLSADVAWPLHLALDEVLSNVVRHGRPADGSRHEIELSFRLEAGEFELTVLDEGMPFDPVAAPEPDTARPAGEREPGGLGIFLVKKLMDEVAYERRAGRNQLVCRRRLGGDTRRGL